MTTVSGDLSGVLQTLIKDLDGKINTASDFLKEIPKLLTTLNNANMPADQIVVEVKHLVEKCVPAADQALVMNYVNVTVPAYLTVLNGSSALKKAETDLKAVVADAKRCCVPCVPWLCSKVAAPVAVVAVADAAAVAEPVAPELHATVEAAGSADILAALAPKAEVVAESDSESKAV
jgi:hypothetical protein